MPPRAKKAAVHDRSINHHNVGLAAPGRPINKSKLSSSNLTPTTPNAHSYDSSPDLSESPLDPVTPPQTTNGIARDPVETADSEMYQMCRVRTPSGGSDSDLEALGINSYKTTTPLRIDVNASGTNRAPQPPKSTLAMATTVLTSCPLWDVIAILIVLLQLPYGIVAAVQILFAVITFVPTSATTSLSNLPTVQDILVGSGGSPSVQTIILVDVLMLLLFVPLWTPAQNIALDLAQAVIAISLGGAAASKGGTTNSVICCLVIIALSHMMRWRSARQIGLNLFWSGLVKYGFQPKGSPPELSAYSSRLYTPQPWPRCLLGVHILAQGVLRLVRRYLIWSNNRTDLQPLSKKQDTDPIGQSPALGTPRRYSISHVPNSDIGLTTSSDGRPPGPSPAAGKDRLSGGKKKKKQSQHVRMQQPFWAALAHTKVTVSKEYEQTQASADAKAAGSVDARGIGSADFKTLQNRVWIKEIGATDILFGVCLPLDQENDVMKEDEDDSMDSEPTFWFVRVNGAAWMSVKRTFKEKIEVGEDKYETWDGKIYGLTPMATYHCEFIRDGDHSVIYDTTLITQAAPSTELAAMITPSTQTLEPSSPTTTLRNSIHAAKSELEALKNNQKVTRRQHKTSLTQVQSQKDQHKVKLSNTGGADDRLRQRVKQLENSIAKSNLEQEDVVQSLADLGVVPEEEKKTYDKAKRDSRDRQRRLDQQKSTSAKSKKESDKGVAAVSNELQTLLNKRGKMQGKQKDKSAQLIDVERKKEAAEQAKTLRVQERQSQEAKRRYLEAQCAEQERQILQETNNFNNWTHQAQRYEQAFRGIQPDVSAPGTPERNAILPAVTSAPHLSNNVGTASLPGSRPTSLHVGAQGFNPTFQFPAVPVPVGSTFSKHGRKRSSSLETEMKKYYGNGAFNLPPGLTHSFMPASSSSALLADSTILAPTSQSGMSPFPVFSPYPLSSAIPAPVGAEKESRRKGSTGSHGSFSRNGATVNGHGGSENGSPRFGKVEEDVTSAGAEHVRHHAHHHQANGVIGLHGKSTGLVSPPGSAIWDRKGLVARE